MKILFILLIIIILYTYIGYGILLWIIVKIKEALFKRVPFPKVTDLPEVSLLIAAYNEEDIVGDKMQNCSALNYPADKLNIVWVTDGSNDKTNELLSAYPNVEVLFQPSRKGKTAAINRAVPLIKTPITIFTDANTMLNRDAIIEIVTLFNKPDVGCVAGEKRILMDEKANSNSVGEGLYWKYESKLKELDSRLYSVVGAAGELFAIRTKLYFQMPEDTLLDDFILSLSIAEQGYRTAYCADAYAIETGSADIHEEEKRKIRIAAGGIQSMMRLLPLLNIFKYGVLSFQYISHRLLRWTITPFALFLLIPVNIWLVAKGTMTPFSWLTLLVQLLFYTCAIIGYILSKKGIKNKLFYTPYYFLFMNINVFRGFNYLRKRKGSGAWEKAKRS